MYKRLITAAIGLAFVALCGCEEIKQDYTLNPDGSGKVKVNRLTPATPQLGGGQGNLDPDKTSLSAAAKMLEEAKGVDAWKDVSWKIHSDGRIHLSGTAYFKDISKLKLGKSAKTVFVKAADGSLTVKLGGMKSSGGSTSKSTPAGKKLSEEELKKKILVEKMKWQQAKGMLTATLAGMETQLTYRLPAKPTRVVGFKPLGDDKSVQIVIKGDDLLKALNSLTSKDEFWSRQITEKGRGQLDDLTAPEMLKMVFGTTEIPAFSLPAGAAPQFDYAAEVAIARKDEGALRKKLGVSATGGNSGSPGAVETEVKTAPDGAALTGLQVKEVKMTMPLVLPKNQGLFPQTPGCQIRLIGQLPGKVLSVKDGAIEKIEASDGTSMLAESKYNRKTQGAWLTGKEKNFIEFSVSMKALPDGVNEVKEISGSLSYSVGSGTKSLDLGELELKKGTTGKHMSAKVSEVNKRFKSVGIQLAADSADSIKGIRFLDDAGKEIPCKKSGSHGWSKKYTFKYRFENEPPAKAKVVIDLYEKLEKRTMPFTAKNLKLR